jgi:hypothetical protein
MVMRGFLLSSVALAALSVTVHAQGLVTNPLIFPTATFTTGNCIQATGATSVASTGAPCGSGGGTGGITGPTTSTIGAIPVWSNGTGTGLADSSILAANIPTLGADQMWGGNNSYAIRPIFNGATPWDSANLTPGDYVTLAGDNTLTGTNTFTGANTFSTRRLFGTATPYDTGNLPAALEPYLLSATAWTT